MTKNWVGFVIGGGEVILVHAEIPENDDDPIVVINDTTWRIQDGGHAEAYEVMHRRCSNYLSENKVDTVVIQASATSKSMKLGHLASAELRGVIMASASSACKVIPIAKGVISRTYGDKKFDEYVDDDQFWADNTTGGELRKTGRKAAMLLIAARNS